MLENLYTTKMSGDAKTLQKRFSKIRTKQSRKSKITAAIMAAVLAMTALFATVAMAAVGADGLEYWDKKEAYYTGGMTFDINVSGLNVPEYIKKDIAGADGIIHCDFKQYDLRFESGMINTTGTLTLQGNSGQIVMPFMEDYWPVGDSEYCKSLLAKTGADYLTGCMFCIDNFKFSYNGWDIFDIPLSDKPHWITMYFAISDNKLKDVIFTFDSEYVLTEDYRHVNIGENMDIPKIENLKLNGNIADTVVSFDKMIRGGRVFNAYEQNGYKNLPVDGFNVSVVGAKENEISIRNDISYSKQSIDFALVQIYDENNVMVFDNNVFNPDMKGVMNITAPNDEKLIRGKRYRVETSYWHEPMGKLVYRHMDYVTIP